MMLFPQLLAVLQQQPEHIPAARKLFLMPPHIAKMLAQVILYTDWETSKKPILACLKDLQIEADKARPGPRYHCGYPHCPKQGFTSLERFYSHMLTKHDLDRGRVDVTQYTFFVKVDDPAYLPSTQPIPYLPQQFAPQGLSDMASTTTTTPVSTTVDSNSTNSFDSASPWNASFQYPLHSNIPQPIFYSTAYMQTPFYQPTMSVVAPSPAVIEAMSLLHPQSHNALPQYNSQQHNPDAPANSCGSSHQLQMSHAIS